MGVTGHCNQCALRLVPLSLSCVDGVTGREAVSEELVSMRRLYDL
jgi:hypothetical protein